MKPRDREAYIARYSARLENFGYSPESLGWGKHGRQDIRFSALAADVLRSPTCSVLDVGCGFADLYDFLRSHGWQGHYRGIELVPAVIEVARKRHPHLDLILGDVAECDHEREQFDYVVASGVFNARLHEEDNCAHIERSLRQMAAMARVAVCTDFLSTHVDYQHPIAWHTDPAWALAVGRLITRRFCLRHDYMPYEFALFLFTDDSISADNVFLGSSRPSVSGDHA